MRVLVIGTGIAGLTAAILAHRRGFEVTVLNKDVDILESNSRWAQGGIVYRGLDDSAELLEQDIKEAAAGLSWPKAVKLVAQKGPEAVDEILLELAKVPFARIDGKLDFAGEAAHSVKRVLYSGDTTGHVIMHSLVEYIKNNTSIKIKTGSMAVDLIAVPQHSNNPLAVYRGDFCMGAWVLDVKTNVIQREFADKVILASGGLGQIYKHTTNPAVATGDGIAMAWRCGAKVVNMEYTQFHPTTLAVKGSSNFLISEAVRGEGGVLLNHLGKDFLSAADIRGSLAPRDILSILIVKELEKSGRDSVYLSLENMQPEVIKKRFPVIYQHCLKYKIDITREPIPVVPAFHFSCGGVLTDLAGRTSLKNLLAVGECACTGLHGANRLASTSLLEGIVFARETVAAINDDEIIKSAWENEVHDWQSPPSAQEVDPILISQDWTTLKSTMWNYVGIVRQKRRMIRALHDLARMKKEADDFYRDSIVTREILELRNAVQCGHIIAAAALRNLKSAGCHWREDAT